MSSILSLYWTNSKVRIIVAKLLSIWSWHWHIAVRIPMLTTVPELSMISSYSYRPSFVWPTTYFHQIPLAQSAKILSTSKISFGCYTTRWQFAHMEQSMAECKSLMTLALPYWTCYHEVLSWFSATTSQPSHRWWRMVVNQWNNKKCKMIDCCRKQYLIWDHHMF